MDLPRIKTKERPAAQSAISNSGNGASSVDSTAARMAARSTQEQLRLDHIETLEILESTTEANKVLKKEVDRLRQQLKESLSASGNNRANGETFDSGTAEAESSSIVTEQFYIDRIAAQDKDIKSLRDKITSLQLQLTDATDEKRSKRGQDADKRRQSEKDSKQLIESLQKQLAEKEQINQSLFGLQKDFESMSQYMSVLKDAGEAEAAKTCALITQLRTEKERETMAVAAAQSELKLTKDLLAERSATLSTLQSEQQMRISHLENLLSLERAKVTELREECSLLEDRFAQAMEDVSTAKAQAVVAIAEQSACSKDARNGGLLCFSTDLCPTCLRSWKSKATVEAAMQTIEELVLPPIAVAEAMQSSAAATAEEQKSFRFEEFVRLRKENKALSMQLADLMDQIATSKGNGAVDLRSSSSNPALSTKSRSRRT